ncbi:hypothetical protein ACF0H5_005054 [Mactra antiquata]
MKTAGILLILVFHVLLVIHAQPRRFMYRPFFIPPPRMYNIGGQPGYFGRWVMKYGGAGPGERFADGEGPPGTREYHASHGHFHGH